MARPRNRLALIAFALCAVTLAACSGGASTPPTDTSVKPLSANEAAPYLTIKSADGTLPCGVFNVNGHGFKELGMTSFPQCQATNYTVLCLNDKATWQADYVNGAKLASNGKSLGFISSQDGICALFPTK
jgi:hypothetical protein